MSRLVATRRAAVGIAAVGGIATLAAFGTGNYTVRFAVGEAGIILNTTDAGASWSQQGSGVIKNLNGVTFSGTSDGCAVGDSGTATATTDGSTWTPAASVPTTAKLNAVDGGRVVESFSFWAVGSGGTILQSFDCSNWNVQTSGTTKNLNGVSFCHCNSADVWAVGDYGHIFATTDGFTWSPETSGVSQGLESVFFVDSQTGWAVGRRGVIIHTVDGGTTWTKQVSGTTLSLDGVAFSDSQHGYVVGANGLILATVNGGATWTAQKSHTSVNLEAVSTIVPFDESTFGDYFDAIAVGKGGVILMTQDGGTTWTKSPSGTTQNLSGTS